MRMVLSLFFFLVYCKYFFLGKMFDLKFSLCLENYVSSIVDDQTAEENPVAKPSSVNKDSRRNDEEKQKSFRELRKNDVNGRSGRSQALQQNDETSDLYLM